MGILKEYNDGLVVAVHRYKQIQQKNLQLHDLIQKKMVGYVHVNYSYWIVYWENDRYYRSFFAKNDAWFNALTLEPQYAVVKGLPQIYLI